MDAGVGPATFCGLQRVAGRKFWCLTPDLDQFLDFGPETTSIDGPLNDFEEIFIVSSKNSSENTSEKPNIEISTFWAIKLSNLIVV